MAHNSLNHYFPICDRLLLTSEKLGATKFSQNIATIKAKFDSKLPIFQFFMNAKLIFEALMNNYFAFDMNEPKDSFIRWRSKDNETEWFQLYARQRQRD